MATNHSSRDERRDPPADPQGNAAAPERLTLRHQVEIALTPGRRRILEILSRERRPLGAYQLIDRVAQDTGKRPAPISIYRALDFLLENNLVHRLASCNSYLACGHGHAAREPIVFLICEACGDVVEATSEAMQTSISDLAQKAHFAPRAQVIELAGVCRGCGAAKEAVA